MRIAFLAWRDLANPLAGGSEVLVDHLASGLADRGHDVTLLCGGPVEPRGYRVVDLGGTYIQYLRAPERFRRQLGDVDVVVDVCNGIPFFAGVWQSKPTVCLVNHVHTDQWDMWFGPTLAAAGRFVERRGVAAAYRRKLFVAVSPSTALSLEAIGVAQERIRLVHNGVDKTYGSAPKSETPLFLAVSRLVPHKRVDILLDIWPRVRAATGGELIIIGDGPERRRLVQQATDGVRFLGYTSDEEKNRLLDQAWLLLHPSQLEGWGLVVMEAAMRRTPSLGFNVKGIRDSIVHRQTGLLAETVDDLADGWIRLTKDGDERTRLGEAARTRAQEFSWSSTVRHFEAVLDEARNVTTTTVVPSATAARPRLARSAAPRDRAGLPKSPSLTIVVPAFDEETRLERSLPLIAARAEQLGAELIFIDDGSTDATAALASEILTDTPSARVVRLPRHRGKGAAVRAGVGAATGQSVVFIDADGATDLDDLQTVVGRLRDVHVAFGSRAVTGAVTSGGSLSRMVMGRNFNRLARAVTGMDIRDFQCGLKAFRTPAAKLLFGLSTTNGFAFDVEVLSLAHTIGYRLEEVPVSWEAVSGSHVRPIRDSVTMGAEVMRLPFKWSHSRVLMALEARGRDLAEPSDVVEAIGPFVGDAGPVVPWKTGALALLPFVETSAAVDMVTEVRRQLPGLDVDLSTMHPRALLGRQGDDLRERLAAG
jgi:glycosyltransferase involved in cell wall biosynthesis